MNHLFGFENFRDFAQKLATHSAKLHIVFHFLKTFAKFRRNFIEIEQKGHFVGKIFLRNMFISNFKKLDAFRAYATMFF